LPTFLRYLRDYIQSRSEISTASDFDLESNDRPNSTDLTPPV
jgi:hypothetical protein